MVGLLDKKEKQKLKMATARRVDTGTVGISTSHTKWPGYINTAVISSRLFRVNRRCCISVASLLRLPHRCYTGSASFYGLNYPLLLAEIVNYQRELVTPFRYRLTQQCFHWNIKFISWPNDPIRLQGFACLHVRNNRFNRCSICELWRFQISIYPNG